MAWTNAEIGMCYKELGNYDEALKYYLIIINSGELDNDIYKKTWVLLEMGNIYKNTNKFEEAVECFRIAEKIVVGDYQFYLDHAYCLVFINHYTEAIAKIEKALELHEDIYPISQLAFCYRKLGEYEKSLRYYLKAESLGREDAWINLEIGLCYKELLDFEKSLAHYLKAYEDEIYKYNTFLLLEIARIYNIFDNYTEAFKFLVRVSEMSKKSKDICIEMGKCLIGLGRYEEAIENFLEARSFSLKVGNSTYEEDEKLAYCYEILGDDEKAKEYKK